MNEAGLTAPARVEVEIIRHDAFSTGGWRGTPSEAAALLRQTASLVEDVAARVAQTVPGEQTVMVGHGRVRLLVEGEL